MATVSSMRRSVGRSSYGYKLCYDDGILRIVYLFILVTRYSLLVTLCGTAKNEKEYKVLFCVCQISRNTHTHTLHTHNRAAIHLNELGWIVLGWRLWHAFQFLWKRRQRRIYDSVKWFKTIAKWRRIFSSLSTSTSTSTSTSFSPVLLNSFYLLDFLPDSDAVFSPSTFARCRTDKNETRSENSKWRWKKVKIRMRKFARRHMRATLSLLACEFSLSNEGKT